MATLGHRESVETNLGRLPPLSGWALLNFRISRGVAPGLKYFGAFSAKVMLLHSPAAYLKETIPFLPNPSCPRPTKCRKPKSQAEACATEESFTAIASSPTQFGIYRGLPDVEDRGALKLIVLQLL